MTKWDLVDIDYIRDRDQRSNLLLLIEIDDVLRRICVSDRGKSSRDNWKEEDEGGRGGGREGDLLVGETE